MRIPYLLAVVLLTLPLSLHSQTTEPAKPKLLIAFASFRDRPKQPTIYFYEHDGLATGKIVGSIATVNLRSDHHPVLSLDGKWCVFSSEIENATSRIFFYDMTEKKLVTLPIVNDSPNAQVHPTISGDGKLIAFAAWDRPGSSTRWDVLGYDVAAKKLIDLPKLNTPASDERMPAFSGDGRWLAFVSNVKGGVGLSDIYLFDRKENKTVAIPEMNCPGLDITPWLNQDGNLIAFASDRPGGQGARDIYLFDRAAKKLLPLPGLNSPANEQTPALSADGRYLAFVSERLAGEGERDVFLYDRQTQKLLPTPGLNSKRDDMDPCVIVVK